MPSGAHTAFRDLLRGTAVQDVMAAGRQVIEVSTNDSVVEGFQRIVNHHILSAPVKDSGTGEYIGICSAILLPRHAGLRALAGFLDIRDLTKFVVSAHEEHKRRQSKTKGTLELPSLNLR